MQISEEQREWIKATEELRLHAYIPTKGDRPTIGYGTTVINNRPVVMGMVITKEQAEQYFAIDLANFEECVSDAIKVEIHQLMFDALVSFCYNVGENAFRSSTLCGLVNERKFDDAAKEFSRWIYVKRVKKNGLVKRRRIEMETFLKGVFLLGCKSKKKKKEDTKE
jgi:lysozyme